MTPDSLRVKQWRENNRERYNETQRVLMEKRRRAAGIKKRKEKKVEPIPAVFTAMRLGNDTATV